MRLLIIGGSDAGISAALRARELDRNIEITVVLADSYPNYSIRGLPFYISGETADHRQLAHRTDFESIELLREHVAEEVAPGRKAVIVRDGDGRSKALPKISSSWRPARSRSCRPDYQRRRSDDRDRGRRLHRDRNGALTHRGIEMT